MKRLAFLLTFILTTAIAMAETKIATIDMELVIISHPKTKENRQVLISLQKDLEKQRDEILNTIKPTVEKFKAAIEAAQDDSLKDSTKKARLDEARAIENRLRKEEDVVKEKIGDLQMDFQKKELELFKSVVDQIDVVVKAYVQKEKITIVLDSSAMRTSAPISIVVFSDESIDITEKIIEATGGKKPE